MSLLRRLQRGLRWFEALLLGFMFFTMILVAVAQIVLRHTSIGGLTWGDAFLRVWVLWLAMAGAVVASRDRHHIGIELAARYLPTFLKGYIGAAVSLFTSVICAALSYYTWQFVHEEFGAGATAFAQVPAWVGESVLPVGFALISLRYLEHTLSDLFRRRAT